MSYLLGASLIVAFMGLIGGAINSLIVGEKTFWPNRTKGVYSPGIFGNMMVGAVAAFVVWGVYGNAASFDVLKNDADGLSLSVFQVVMSIPVGMSGGRILMGMAERNGDKLAKDNFARIVERLMEK